MNCRTLGFWLVIVTFTAVVAAQEQKSEKTPDTPNSEVLRRLLEKVDQLDRDLKTVLKNAPQPFPENPEDRKLVALLETPVVQSFNFGVRNGQSVEPGRGRGSTNIRQSHRGPLRFSRHDGRDD